MSTLLLRHLSHRLPGRTCTNIYLITFTALLVLRCSVQARSTGWCGRISYQRLVGTSL
ncbi:hypothetical protein CJF30_00004842 [Rutstroemia sp. NJR-2017a BBW]|nr:hypothetical protein CJF30_00004842 [Rutstroemia sp. NJR-2017a BBW]